MTDIRNVRALRRTSIALGIALAVSLAACGGGGDDDAQGPPDMKTLDAASGPNQAGPKRIR